MILDLEVLKMFLIDEQYTAYGLEKLTGVGRTTISNLRRGDADFEGMQIGTLIRVQEFLDENPKLKKGYDKALGRLE